MINLGTLEADALLGVLQQAGFRPKRHPAIVNLGALRALQLLYEPPGAFVDLQVDVLLTDSDYHRQALRGVLRCNSRVWTSRSTF